MASERVVVQHQLPPLGRHLVKKVWSEVKVMDYHHWKSPSSPWSRMLIPHSILPNHTEGHRLNGRDVLSRKAGLRLGKDSIGVEASPNQDKLRRMNKYCRLQGLNRCPLAWRPFLIIGYCVYTFWKKRPLTSESVSNNCYAEIYRKKLENNKLRTSMEVLLDNFQSLFHHCTLFWS